MRNLILNLEKLSSFKNKLLVIGDHLVKSKGFTLNEIIKDKVNIANKIKISKSFYDSKSNSIDSLQSKIRSSIKKLNPDIVILLGDRKEILLAALSCFFLNLKIVHISGGEKTIGSKDDIHRHLISKLSDYHFVSDKAYKKRLIQLGEDKNNIFIIGSLSTEKIRKIAYKTKNFLEKKYNFQFKLRNSLITFHPDTTMSNYRAVDFDNLLKSLSNFPNLLKIFTYPNSDKGSEIIIKKIKTFKKNNINTIIIKSFGQEDYFSIIHHIDFIIGNSSSGITEVPLFKKPTINIGDRQKGRLISSTIISCNAKKNDITKEINKVFKNKRKKILNKIYFNKDNVSKIAIEHLKDIVKRKKNIKSFIDIP